MTGGPAEVAQLCSMRVFSVCFSSRCLLGRFRVMSLKLKSFDVESGVLLAISPP